MTAVEPELIEEMFVQAAAFANQPVPAGDRIGVVERGKLIEKWLENAVHKLKGAPFVADIRNCGASAAIDLERAHHRRDLQDVAGEMLLDHGSHVVELQTRHLETSGHLTLVIERRRGGTEHHLAGVGLQRVELLRR